MASLNPKSPKTSWRGQHPARRSCSGRNVLPCFHTSVRAERDHIASAESLSIRADWIRHGAPRDRLAACSLRLPCKRAKRLVSFNLASSPRKRAYSSLTLSQCASHSSSRSSRLSFRRSSTPSPTRSGGLRRSLVRKLHALSSAVVPCPPDACHAPGAHGRVCRRDLT
jgi:hypothetical protein